MQTEILCYYPLYSYTVSEYITKLEANKNNDISVRIHSPGGDVYASYGAIAKTNEHSRGKVGKIDGRADSASFFMVCTMDNVECLNVSKAIVHRAAYPDYIEKDPSRFTDAIKAELTTVNAELRTILESKVSARKWKTVTGVSMDDLFSLNSRIDVELNAEQLLNMGLIQKINPLTKEKNAEIKALIPSLAAEYAPLVEAENQPLKINKMTIAEVKADSVYAQIKVEILTDEKDRIGAFAEFATIDPVAVLAEIVAGNKFTQTFAAKMNVKAMSAGGIKNITAANAPAVAAVMEPVKTAEEKATADAMQEMETINAMVAGRLGVKAQA